MGICVCVSAFHNGIVSGIFRNYSTTFSFVRYGFPSLKRTLYVYSGCREIKDSLKRIFSQADLNKVRSRPGQSAPDAWCWSGNWIIGLGGRVWASNESQLSRIDDMWWYFSCSSTLDLYHESMRFLSIQLFSCLFRSRLSRVFEKRSMHWYLLIT